jgi:hypothetical protein
MCFLPHSTLCGHTKQLCCDSVCRYLRSCGTNFDEMWCGKAGSAPKVIVIYDTNYNPKSMLHTYTSLLVSSTQFVFFLFIPFRSSRLSALILSVFYRTFFLRQIPRSTVRNIIYEYEGKANIQADGILLNSSFFCFRFCIARFPFIRNNFEFTFSLYTWVQRNVLRVFKDMEHRKHVHNSMFL